MHQPTAQGNAGAASVGVRLARTRTLAIRVVRMVPETVDQRSHGDNMLKMNRLATLAAALMLALPIAVTPLVAQAQPQSQPATPAPNAPPADNAGATAAAAPAPTPPAVAPAPGASGKATTEIIENPYGLEALWKGGDLVARITLGILVIMSMGSWYVIITKVYEQAKMGRQARAADRTFWTAPSVQKGAVGLKEGSPYRFIAESGLEATTKHEGLLGNVNINDWISMSIQRAIDNVQSRTQDGLAFLATVGSTAPFVGLFGTVWGVYHALTAIGIAGQASIDKVAGPVGEALIMTAIGLAVAVPAVLGYNWLIRRNKVALDRVRGFGADLHAVLLSAPQVAAKA
jgi:biopolymer transport protein ExbB